MKTNQEKIANIKVEFLKLKEETISLINQVDTSKNNHIQNYIYFACYPIFSFTESVIILCKNSKSNVAKVLLRTLFEAHIDVIYHQLGNSDQCLALSARDAFQERWVILDEIGKLIKKYPNLASTDPKNLFNEIYLEKTKEITEKQKEAVLRANHGLEKIKKLKLRHKAELCDGGQVKNSEPGHFGRMYSLIYRQLSPIYSVNFNKQCYFTRSTSEGDFSDDNAALLLVCYACGAWGCWDVFCNIQVLEDRVVWSDFKHSHRDWKYDLRFEFEKKQYMDEFSKIIPMFEGSVYNY